MKNNTMIPYNPKKDLETNYYNKTEIELLIAGGSGGSIEGVTLAQTTGSGTDVIMSQKAVSDRIEYTNSNPVPTAIGGIKAGTTFNKTPINDVLDMLLYPYQNPSFGAFSIDGQSSGNFELGYAYPGGSKLFTWRISNPGNLKENSITLNSESGLPNTGSKSQTVASITKNTAGSHTFTIKAQNSNNVEFTRNITFNWLAKRFWGVSSSEELTDAELLTFSQELASNKNKSLKYDCTGGKYFYFAYPSSFGDANNITVESMAWNGFVLVKRNVVNINGVSIPMNIYRSMELLNGQVNVAWA